MNHYLLRRKKTTNEIHIFQVNSPSICDEIERTQCGKIHRLETEILMSYCIDESAMRLHVTLFGNQVCGQCVATLYGSF